MAKVKRNFADAITGGLSGAGAAAPLAASMTKAGMGSWNPWLIGGGIALGAAGNLLAGEAEEDDPVYQMQKEGLQLDNDARRLGLKQAARSERRSRRQDAARDEFGTLLGNMFRAAKGGFGDQVMRPPV